MRPLALALLVVATFGCDRLLGIEDLPRAILVDAGPDAEPPFVNEACIECGKAQCTDSRDKCLADPSCSQLLTCMMGCRVDGPVCRFRCKEASGGADRAPLWTALESCAKKGCSDKCYGTGGLLTGIDANCACAEAECRPQTLNCMAMESGDCERRLACIGSDANPDKYVECVNAFSAEGVGEKADAVLDCARAATSCTDTCTIPKGVVACKEKYTFETARPNTVTFTLGVEDATGTGIKDAAVQACVGSCAKCLLPAGTGTSNADGKAPIELNMKVGGANGFTGCFRVTPPARGSGEEPYLPLVVFPGRTIRQPENLFSTVVLEGSTIDFFAAKLSSVWDRSRGAIIGVVQDCIWGRVLEAQVTLDPMPTDGSVLLAYLDGASIKEGATGTVNRAGFAFVNVPPGTYKVVVTKKGDEIVRTPIEVIAGSVTDATVFPKGPK